MNVLIVSGGNIGLNFNKNYDKIIAVDKGLESLYKLNINPDYIVGDFDSVDKSILDFYRNKNVQIIEYDSEKDYTDTELGLELAIKLNPSIITIVGAIGTRIDHTLANIHILANCIDKGIFCEIIDEHNKIYLVNNHKTIEKQKLYGQYISIIPLTTEVKEITLKGFKYPLENYTLSIGKSLGISNEVINDIATIDCKEGILIVIESKD